MKFNILKTRETIEGELYGTDEMIENEGFYQILVGKNGKQYHAYYYENGQPDALDEYDNLDWDRIDYHNISELKEIDEDYYFTEEELAKMNH